MKPFISKLAFYLMIITGIASVITGALLIIDPSGSLIGKLIVYFKYPVYDSLLTTGFILLSIYGLININFAISLNGHRADFLLILGQGGQMITLTLVHAFLVGDFNLLHGFFTAIGAILIACSLILREPLNLSR